MDPLLRAAVERREAEQRAPNVKICRCGCGAALHVDNASGLYWRCDPRNGKRRLVGK